MDDKSDIKEIIRNYVIEEFIDGEDEISNDTPLISGGYLDSFSMVSIVVFLEKKFGIKIPPVKVKPESFDSVNKIAAVINDVN